MADPEPFSRYTFFMVVVYEGGMVAYPLYASLCGNENLSQIAPLPCGHCVARGAAGGDDPGDALTVHHFIGSSRELDLAIIL